MSRLRIQKEEILCNIHQSDLTSVCVDSKCNNRGMICQICARENHMTHVIIPFQELQDFLRNDTQIRQVETRLSQEIKEIEGNIDQVLQAINKIFSNISLRISDMKLLLRNTYRKYNAIFSLNLKAFSNNIDTILFCREGCQEQVSLLLSNDDFLLLNQDNYYIQNVQFSQLKEINNQLSDFTDQFQKCNAKIYDSFNQIDQFLSQHLPTKGPQIDSIEETCQHSQQYGVGYIPDDISHSVQKKQKTDLNESQRNYLQKFITNTPGEFILNNNDDNNSPLQNYAEVVQQISRNNSKSQMMSPNKSQLSKCKFRFTPSSRKELQSVYSEIDKNQSIKSLWLDIPLQSTQNDVTEFAQILKMKKQITKLFINFSKTTKLDNQSLYQLFDSINSLSSLQILSLKIKGCIIDQQFKWELLVNTICFLQKKSLTKVLLVVSEQVKKDIQAIITLKKNCAELFDLVDFN